mmetsp:Transcript_130361/g.193996  ORF Transcript_130361/g.193996 Transcript_130361/m.193996 type:complete len:415 (+) Transcript_130361:129-1373(+)
MEQQGNGAPDRGPDASAPPADGGQADRQGNNAAAPLSAQSSDQHQAAFQQQIASLPAQALEQHAALQQQQGTLMPQGFHPAGSYNQQIVQNAALQAVAALAAIADQASQQQHQHQGLRLASGQQDPQAAVASLVSTLAAQQPGGANLLGNGALAAQLGGILPMMLAPLQQAANQQGQPLSQTPAWYSPAMNSTMNYPASSVGYAAAPVGTVGYRPSAAAPGNQEAQSSAAGIHSSNPAAGMPQATPASQVGVAAASGATRVHRPTVPLFLDYDREVLTEYQCLLRQQIELFEAGPEDIRENVKGRIKPVRVNQLGIRCRHCSMLPPESRARGAVYFAYNVEGIYQLAQNMGKKHLCDGCGEIPTALKQRLSQMYRSKENNNRRAGGKAYWVESLAVLGVYKDKSTGMLRLKPPR